MKILKLTADNFKKLSAVEITPDGNVVIISGKNAAGKSSVLDAPEAALCGGRCLPKQPIKTGENSGRVTVVLGEDGEPAYKVTRKFFGTTSRLTVETVGETRTEVKSPQSFLDSIVGNISFDPLEFLKKTPAEQRTSFMEFLGLNLDEFDNKIIQLKNQRSDVRKEKERLQHTADSITRTLNVPEVEVSSETLLAELKAIQIYNEKCQKIAVANASHQTQLVRLNEDILAAQKAVLDWQKRLDTLADQRNDLVALLQKQPELPKVDTAEVETKLQTLEETNKAIRLNAEKRLAATEADGCTQEYSDLGAAIKIAESNKVRKMAESVMPVKGLAIQADGLSFGGIPLEQVNGAKKLEVCVAIAISMNPKLKVLRINGNDLDAESLSTIGRLADKQGYQIWIEKVSDDKTIGFYIEDGSLVSGDVDENQQ